MLRFYSFEIIVLHDYSIYLCFFAQLLESVTDKFLPFVVNAPARMIMDDVHGLLGVSNLGQEDTAGDDVGILAAVSALLRVSLYIISHIIVA